MIATGADSELANVDSSEEAGATLEPLLDSKDVAGAARTKNGPGFGIMIVVGFEIGPN